MKKQRILKVEKPCMVGIDPDTIESGVAVWDGKALVALANMDFWTLIRFLDANKDLIASVVIEGGWLNKSNFHLAEKQGKQGLAETGRRVGMNHQTGILIAEFLSAFVFPHQVVAPLKNNWWKKDAKRFAVATQWKGRTNAEKRDAAMLVVGRPMPPLIIKT